MKIILKYHLAFLPRYASNKRKKNILPSVSLTTIWTLIQNNSMSRTHCTEISIFVKWSPQVLKFVLIYAYASAEKFVLIYALAEKWIDVNFEVKSELLQIIFWQIKSIKGRRSSMESRFVSRFQRSVTSATWELHLRTS